LLEVYGTFPLARGSTPQRFVAPILDVARWSESAGLRGLLIFTDNDSADPWAAAQYLLERTATLVPLVAVQPLYMHPYTAARLVSSLSSMYGRRLDLNLVAGGYLPHMRALGCTLDHDERYARLTEYGQILLDLLRQKAPLTRRTTYFDVQDARLHPPLPAHLDPTVFVAGTSPAAAATARALGAARLIYPEESHVYAGAGRPLAGCGIRFGIIARDDTRQAWRLAAQRFPTSEALERLRGQHVDHFDAQWHQEIWEQSTVARAFPATYWLYPFRVAREFCPYLVGSHQEVAAVLSRYIELGIDTLILNQARAEDDVFHAMEAIRQAERLAHPTQNSLPSGSSITT
jgi:alkanesulfonate monooxygenase